MGATREQQDTQSDTDEGGSRLLFRIVNTTPRMEQSEHTIQTHPIIRITKTLSRHIHGVL
jgi:hypothetical protein